MLILKESAVQLLQQGGVIAYPTESVFGLGCDPNNESALRRILLIKGRHLHKGMILITSAFEQIIDYIDMSLLDNESLDLLQSHQLEPTTWLVPCLPHVSKLIVGEHNKIAIRFTSHQVARFLCEQSGFPLISTSANISGQPPCKEAREVDIILGEQLDGVVNESVDIYEKPSRIIDLLSQERLR